MNNGAVIWKTGQPYINEPIIKLYQETNSPQMEELRKIEHATSDWCADTSSLKVSYFDYCYYYNMLKIKMNLACYKWRLYANNLDNDT